MRSKLNMIVSTLGLLTLAGLMAGCVSGRVTGSCPNLSPPPIAAVDALQSAGSNDVDAWVVDLERHYQKLDACRGV